MNVGLLVNSSFGSVLQAAWENNSGVVGNCVISIYCWKSGVGDSVLVAVFKIFECNK